MKNFVISFRNFYQRLLDQKHVSDVITNAANSKATYKIFTVIFCTKVFEKEANSQSCNSEARNFPLATKI